MKYKLTLFAAALLLLTGCNIAQVSKADGLPSSTPQTVSRPKKKLADIDLTTIKHTVPQGRVQDGGLEDENFKKLPIADELLAHGKDSIPFLIGKLDDETEMDRQTIDFWNEVRVGDMALAILSDFFTRKDETTSTITGFGWDDFLERGDDKDSTAEAVLRKYIEKHGRKEIKARWQKVWDENKENIVWNETERCFMLAEYGTPREASRVDGTRRAQAASKRFKALKT